MLSYRSAPSNSLLQMWIPQPERSADFACSYRMQDVICQAIREKRLLEYITTDRPTAWHRTFTASMQPATSC
jgi:hypothetical protein